MSPSMPKEDPGSGKTSWAGAWRKILGKEVKAEKAPTLPGAPVEEPRESENMGNESKGDLMNCDRIGQAAGAIWKKLHEKGPAGVALADIKKLSTFSADEILAGIGWLAREGKLSFKESPGKKAVLALVGEEVFA